MIEAVLADSAINGQSLQLGLIDIPDSFGRSALSWAVEYGWVDAVSTLIRFGADVNQQRLPLHAGLGLPMLHLALAGPNFGKGGTAYLDIVRQLLIAGADVNAVDHEGWTALHIAASWKDHKAVGILAQFAGQRLCWSALTNSNESASQLAGGDGSFVELVVSHEIDQHLEQNLYQLPS
jgi:ankyrin repeat protein